MNLTVADWNQALATTPQFVREAFRRHQVASGEVYADFVDFLYKDLDRAIFALQAGRELLQDDSEDRITADLMRQMRQLGYRAIHDSKTGGHVDLSVELGEFSWIGEAKKDGNFKEGFLQLMTRYVPASGNYSHNAGGLLFYLVKTKKALAMLEKWMKEIGGDGTCEKCANNVLAFYSEHELEGSGTMFRVRTMGVSLYHDPKDKAARAKEGRRAAREAKEPTAKEPTPKRGVKKS